MARHSECQGPSARCWLDGENGDDDDDGLRRQVLLISLQEGVESFAAHCNEAVACSERGAENKDAAMGCQGSAAIH